MNKYSTRSRSFLSSTNVVLLSRSPARHAANIIDRMGTVSRCSQRSWVFFCLPVRPLVGLGHLPSFAERWPASLRCCLEHDACVTAPHTLHRSWQVMICPQQVCGLGVPVEGLLAVVRGVTCVDGHARNLAREAVKMRENRVDLVPNAM